uniref:UPAR/Ly6 domain-containing protein n=1 Tax=Anolis carolinensis TaxID=28377 RepID=A0A803T097_ANOCA
MQILLGALVCLFLATSGNALYCEVCTSFGTSCTGSLQTCKDGNDTCIIAVAENTLVGQTLQTITKGCVSSSICKAGLTSMNFGQGKKIRSSTICCVGEACRTAVPQIPPLISQTNGKQCPACYAVSPSSCNEDEIVECVGSEDSCLDMAVTVTYGNSNFICYMQCSYAFSVVARDRMSGIKVPCFSNCTGILWKYSKPPLQYFILLFLHSSFSATPCPLALAFQPQSLQPISINMLCTFSWSVKSIGLD